MTGKGWDYYSTRMWLQMSLMVLEYKPRRPCDALKEDEVEWLKNEIKTKRKECNSMRRKARRGAGKRKK